MVLFITLLLTLAILTTITVLAISAGGAVFVIIFGDVIVCAFIIIQIMKRIAKKKK